MFFEALTEVSLAPPRTLRDSLCVLSYRCPEPRRPFGCALHREKFSDEALGEHPHIIFFGSPQRTVRSSSTQPPFATSSIRAGLHTLEFLVLFPSLRLFFFVFVLRWSPFFVSCSPSPVPLEEVAASDFYLTSTSPGTLPCSEKS